MFNYQRVPQNQVEIPVLFVAKHGWFIMGNAIKIDDEQG
jgi:hypothetical protein